MNKSLPLRTLSLLALLLMAGSRVSAESINSVSPLQTSVEFKLPRVPSRGAPGSRGQGASRGECIRSEKPFTAIVPSVDAKPKANIWGLTTVDHPTLLAYIPFAQRCTKLELILQDEAGKTVYQMPIVAPAKPSLIGIQIPASAPVLKPNSLYHWLLKATVTPSTRQESDDASGSEKLSRSVYSIDGWIQRVNMSASLNQQLKQASPQQKARLYAENGIWFEAAATLAELRSTKPQDATVAKDWEQLLQSVKLEKFATESIVPAKILVSGQRKTDGDCIHQQKCR